MAVGAAEKGTDEPASTTKAKRNTNTKKGEGTRGKRASRTKDQKSSVAASIMDDSAMQSEQFDDLGQDMPEVRVTGDGESLDESKNAT